jgi:molecular chaperone DnaK (HSP70)
MSSLAMIRAGEVHVLRTPGGRYEVPSVVALDGDRLVVGEPARERLVVDPQNAIASPKRLLGRRHDDRELEPFLATLAMPHRGGPDGEVLLEPGGYRLRVCEVCAPIFATLRELAEQQLGQAVRAAVLTVPVSFDERRCQALIEAASLANLEVLATLDEPTAAALTYSDDPSYRDLVAVYDFGGGTFDFSVVDVSSADVQVVATAGDTWLGGDDLDDPAGLPEDRAVGGVQAAGERAVLGEELDFEVGR